MQEEAGLLSGVLAAALNQFKDDLIRDPDIEHEWAELCRPVRQELWPRTFGGETAALIAEYRRIAEVISAGDAAAAVFLAAATSMGSPGAGQ
jgi:DNA-binding FadR family transcriptional regulator